MYLTTHLPALHEALQGGVRVDLIAFRTPVRAECYYKIAVERKVGEKLSEMVQPLISSVTFYDSMKHYRARNNSAL